MSPMTAWFIVGLIVVTMLALYAPKFAGVVVVLVAIVLGIQAANKRLV